MIMGKGVIEKIKIKLESQFRIKPSAQIQIQILGFMKMENVWSILNVELDKRRWLSWRIKNFEKQHQHHSKEKDH